MDRLWHDLRFAFRTLGRRPGFTVVTTLTLALGIGATTAIFGLVAAIVLNPLPYEEPDRLVVLWDTQPNYGDAPASYPEYLDWRQNAEVFDEVAAHFRDRVTLTGDGEPERLEGARVSANLFATLGITPLLGRELLPEDEPPGAGRVVVLSHGFWQRRFGGSEAALGTTLRLDGEGYTVVGVLPPGVDAFLPFDLQGNVHREVWMPLRLDEASSPRGLHYLGVLGRLAPGVTREQAGAQVTSLAALLRDEGRTLHGIRVGDLGELVVGEARPRLLALLGAVGFVLLICCVNVANLLLVRAAGRGKEIAVRQAVGASRGQLVRQLVTESLVLALLGGLVGTALAAAALRGFAASGFGDLPRMAEVGFDPSLLLFAGLLTALTAVFFGVAPALIGTSADLTKAFRDAGRQGASGGSQSLRSLLVIAEVALSLMLLIGAGLLTRSLTALFDVDLGFRPQNVAGAGLLLPASRYGDDPARVRFFDQVLERAQALPGVEKAAFTNALPLDGGPNGDVAVEGVTVAEDEPMLAEKRRISPDYFETMGIPLVRGRGFTDRDVAGAPPVAVVNQEFVRRFLGGREPIGLHVDFQWNNEGMQEIVGVVGDVRHNGATVEPGPAIYVPYRQNAQAFMLLMLRSRQPPAALAAGLRREVAALDRDMPLSEVLPMDLVVDRNLAQNRLAATLLGGFAAFALFLAALGIYGVLSFSAASRTQEIGIRMALGAGRNRILGQFAAQGLALAAIGAGVGVAGALFLTRFLSGLLFRISATDPGTFAGVVLVMLAVALAAGLLPARRAARVDPVVALRGE